MGTVVRARGTYSGMVAFSGTFVLRLFLFDKACWRTSLYRKDDVRNRFNDHVRVLGPQQSEDGGMDHKMGVCGLQ